MTSSAVDAPARIDPARRVQAWVLALAGPGLVTGLLLPARDSSPSAVALLALLALTLAAATLGGRAPAGCLAGLGAVLVGWFLLPSSQAPGAGRPFDLVALAGFLGLAVWLVRLTERTAQEPAAPAGGTERSDTLTG